MKNPTKIDIEFLRAELAALRAAVKGSPAFVDGWRSAIDAVSNLIPPPCPTQPKP
jgi:hypothetical protein